MSRHSAPTESTLLDAGVVYPVRPPRLRGFVGWWRGFVGWWRGFFGWWRGFVGWCVALAAAAEWLLVTQALPGTAAEPGGVFSPPLPPPLTVVASFALPAQPWLPGNRGVDLATSAGEPVRAATDGVVVYAGELAGRGVVSIGHGRLRVSYEPVDSLIHVGEQVERGQLIGHVSGEADACGPPGTCLHWGVRDGASYVDPMKLLTSHPPVRLLPIWTDGVPPIIAAPAATEAPTTSPASFALANHAASMKPSEPTPTSTPAATVLVAEGAAVLGGVAALGAATFAAIRRTAQDERVRAGGG